MGDNRRKPSPRQRVSGVEARETSSVDPDPDSPTELDSHPETEVDDDETPTPRFMRDDGARKRWKWVPYPVQKMGHAVATWSRGPPNARAYKIDPLLPAVQQAPLLLLNKLLPNRKHRAWLFILYAICWLLAFILVFRQGLLTSDAGDFGRPQDIGCGTTYWTSGNTCGLDGNDCRPFNNGSFAFKCPANCASYQLLNPRAVGDQEIVYQTLVVGGPPDAASDLNSVYRGDSFICAAAIHAGIVTNSGGGCGVVTVIGTQANYISSIRHGISSVGFNSYFPLSFTFQTGVECSSKDVRWSLLGVSVAFTSVLSLLTSSAGLFFFPVFIGVFWQVGMASDAPNIQVPSELFTDILGKFLPAMFIAWVFYDRMGVRRTLNGLTAQIEKTVLWLGGCWVGALANYTFELIPISRLNSADLSQQPGAKAALSIIVIVLFVVVVTQIWYFRQEGRLLKYLKLYALFIFGIIICLLLPDLSLRIHHYIIALLLLPGTSMQTRPALLYQGILVGLFINGVARWSFDPFLQTSVALQRDAPSDSLLPTVLAPAIILGTSISNITFKWGSPPETPRYDGISALVNDVERFRTYFDETGKDSFVWTRNASLGLNEYFRFAYMDGNSPADYTKAGTWSADGNWTEMAAGPSKIRRRGLDDESVALMR